MSDALAQPLAQAASLSFGPFLSWWKMLIFVVILLIWLRLLLWIDKDSDNARMPREGINSGLWGLLVIGLGCALFLPFFPLALAAFAILASISIGGYLIWRKQVVGLEDIPEQLSGFFANAFTFGKGGERIANTRAADVALGLVTLLDSRGNAPKAPEPEDAARAGYDTAHRVLADPLYRGAERISFVQVASKPAADGEGVVERFATKYTIDGFDYPGSAFEAASASDAAGFLKSLAGLNRAERRKVQKGKMKARTARGSHDLTVTSSGSRTGESIVFEVDANKRFQQRATALGMTPQQREAIVEAVADRVGVGLLAAPQGGGLDSMLYGMLQEHDAFTQHLITMERNEVRRDVEGVTQQTLADGADQAEEQKQFSWIADQQPDVFMTDRVLTRGGALELIRLARDDNHRAYAGIRAPDTASAITFWLKLVGDPKTAVVPLRLAMASRILRKLCESCKVPYEPPEAVLAKMGVPKGKVKTLFKARTEPMVDQRGNPIPCEFCGQLGYSGRVGAFEVLLVDDALKAALRQDPSPQGVQTAVRNALRQQKSPTINEAALRQVMAGRTDLQEVQRVMSSGTTPSTGKSAGRQSASAA